MRNNSADEQIWRISRLFFFGFTVCLSCALGSPAAAQTSFSRLIGGGEESEELHSLANERTLPGAITANRSGTLLDAGALAAGHWRSQARHNGGALTLATHRDNSFPAMVNSKGVDLVSSHTFGGDALERQLIESATQKRVPARNLDRADTNSISFPVMATFPEKAVTAESALALEITPVSEPETWIAAALAAAFLIWKARKSLMAWLGYRHFIRRLRVLFQNAKFFQSVETGRANCNVIRSLVR